MENSATLSLRQWAIVNEALSEYVEKLREDDDSHNNAIADDAEAIDIPAGDWDA